MDKSAAKPLVAAAAIALALVGGGCSTRSAPTSVPLRDAPTCDPTGRPHVEQCGFGGALQFDLTQPGGVRQFAHAVDNGLFHVFDPATIGVDAKVLRRARVRRLIGSAAAQGYVWVEWTGDPVEPERAQTAMRTLGAMPGIEGIVLGGVGVSPAALLAFLEQQPTLRAVRVGGALVDADVLAAIASLPDLRSLTLWGPEVTDESLAALSPLARLESLTLRNTPVTGSGLAHLSALRNLRALELSAPLDRVEYELAVHGLGSLAGLPRLTTVTLRRYSLAGLSAVQTLPHLHTLSLHGSKGVDDLESVAGLHGLVSLDLSATDVGSLEPLRALTSLETLNLARTQAHALDVLTDLKRLRSLNLTGIAIDWKWLDSLGGLPHLEVVRVSQNLCETPHPFVPLACEFGPRPW